VQLDISNSGNSRFTILELAALVAVPLIAFAGLAAIVIRDPEPALDYRLLAFLHGHTEGTSFGDAASLLVWVCLWLGLIGLLTLLGALSLTRRYAPALFLVSATLGVIVFERALKSAFEREPINHGESYSFPSGSAMVSLAVVAACVCVAGRGHRAWAFAGGTALVFVYGLSIVSLGWHYPSDVVAGWCFALALVSALWFGLGRPTLGRANA
jgi:membrane-associated phospholipid phosphatase